MASWVTGLPMVRDRTLALLHKIWWGGRTAGVVSTVTGVARLVALEIRRPKTSQIRLRSGPDLEFDFPRQLVPALVVFGDFIDPEFAFLSLVNRPGWTFVDVGAAIGQFSVFAAQLPGAMVHAFEPSLDNVRTLERNLLRNDVRAMVGVHLVALSDANGEADFATSPNPFLSRLDRAPASMGSVRVKVRTMCSMVNELNIDRIDCLKINVAGYEDRVLRGAEGLLQAGRVRILILLISEGSIPWLPDLSEFGFRFFFFHPKRLSLHPVTRFDRESMESRPWPARHVIGLLGAAVEDVLVGGIRIVNGF